MALYNNIGRMLLAGAFVTGTVLIVGCTKAPTTKEVSSLEEKRSAAESAEKKLADLRAERLQLEHDLQVKQAQLQQGKADLQKTETAKSAGTSAQAAPAAKDTAKAQAATPATPAAPVSADTAKARNASPTLLTPEVKDTSKVQAAAVQAKPEQQAQVTDTSLNKPK